MIYYQHFPFLAKSCGKIVYNFCLDHFCTTKIGVPPWFLWPGPCWIKQGTSQTSTLTIGTRLGFCATDPRITNVTVTEFLGQIQDAAVDCVCMLIVCVC